MKVKWQEENDKKKLYIDLFLQLDISFLRTKEHVCIYFESPKA